METRNPDMNTPNTPVNEVYYGYYSLKQFDIISKNNDHKDKYRPYIYYYTENDDIVQITEISKNKNLKNFKDVKKLGIIKKFHSVSNKPLKF